jgi:hypothetical protein
VTRALPCSTRHSYLPPSVDSLQMLPRRVDHDRHRTRGSRGSVAWDVAWRDAFVRVAEFAERARWCTECW